MQNMCDGCQRGLEIRDSIRPEWMPKTPGVYKTHPVHVGSNGHVIMTCTKNRYKGEDDVQRKRTSGIERLPTKG